MVLGARAFSLGGAGWQRMLFVVAVRAAVGTAWGVFRVPNGTGQAVVAISGPARPVLELAVPAGAVPKDGPSAGITMATALVSLATGRPVRSDVAMTGEITLHGRVLPVGGIKEKVLAAHRAGIRTVILPKENERDTEDVPAEARRDLQFQFVDDAFEVVRLALAEGASV